MGRITTIVIVLIIMTVLDLHIAYISGRKTEREGKLLARTSLSAAVVATSYAASLLMAGNYMGYKIANALYFSAIDSVLLSFLFLIIQFVRHPNTRKNVIFRRMIVAAGLIDIVIELINPFREIAIRYPEWSTKNVLGGYDPLIFYTFHLAFTYMLIVLILFLLVEKIRISPRHYKSPYVYVALGILGVVAINAGYLYLRPLLQVDYSLLAYTLVIAFVYWVCFHYSQNKLLSQYQNMIFDNLNQGVVLFDYEGKLIVNNSQVLRMLPDGMFDDTPDVLEFAGRCDIDLRQLEEKKSFSFLWYPERREKRATIQCECRYIESDDGEMIGTMFVFTDMAPAVDLLTGYVSWDHFRHFLAGELSENDNEIVVTVCDINALSTINTRLGRNVGDQAIILLSHLLREEFPPETLFVRGVEARLIAINCDVSSQQIKAILEKVRIRFHREKKLGTFLSFQSAVRTIREKHGDVLAAINLADKSVTNKKLMDKQSLHSPILNSLIRTLRECDSETEEHVKRTQILGEKLGRRIGLSDVEQSDLALLCILHDIGKIGIPLEILNKPGRLTREEWETLKTHTEKGYQIALSTPELEDIAPMIRFHHERWDGNGYPTGIKGERIPVLSRVIAVIDSYDAMTNDRPYRQRRSVQAAIDELIRCAGKQFDPNIATAFVQMILEEGILAADEAAATAEHVEPVSVSVSEEMKPGGHLREILYSRYVVDGNLRIIDADQYFEQITGYSLEEVQKRHMTQADLIFPEDRSAYYALIRGKLESEQRAYIEHRIVKKDGSPMYVFCYGRPYFDSAAREERTEILITEIQEADDRVYEGKKAGKNRVVFE